MSDDKCDTCKGSGECSECDGKKVLRSGARCPECEGDGLCDRCNGTGKESA